MSSSVRFTGASGKTYAYESDDAIGRGTFGQVFRGVEEMTGQAVAVKTVPISTSSATRYVIEGTLVERELDIMRQLTQAKATHVMPLLDFAHTSAGSHDELRLVMPLAERSLDDHVRHEGTLSEEDTRTLLQALSTGMQHVHEAGVLHRDINPRNVLLLEGRWVLSDFGIAKDDRQIPSTTTWKGTGTLEYWAPELFRGENASPQSDMFATGATVLEALTGSVVFPGPRHQDQRIAFDIGTIRTTDRVLSRTIAMVLALEPQNRPRTAKDITRLLASKPAAATATQRRLESLLRMHIEEDRKRDESHQEQLRLQRLRDTGLSSMRYVWGTFVSEIHRSDPNAEETDQDDASTFDRSLVIGSDRLHVAIRAAANPATAVLVGEVRYANKDHSGVIRVANIVCTESGVDDSLDWRLTRYSRNHAYPQHRPETHRLDSEGVDLDLLEEQLTQARERLGATVLFEESEAMTSESLLTALLDAAEKKREGQT